MMRRSFMVVFVSAVLGGACLTAVPAVAGPSPAVSSGGDGKNFWASVRGTVRVSGSGARGVASIPASFVPPTCWYAPTSYANLMRRWQWIRYMMSKMGDDREPGVIEPWLKDREKLESYKDKKKEGKDGRFYQLDGESSDAGWKCMEGKPDWVFVTPAEPGPPAPIIDRAMLLRIARAALRLPTPRVSLNPRARSFVNLPTRVRSNNPAALDVTATNRATGESVTLIARPAEFIIQPGGPATVSHNASSANTCVNIARPTDRCSVRYERSSYGQPGDAYVMTITQFWDVTAGGAPIDPRGSVPGTARVVVSEIQTNVTD